MGVPKSQLRVDKLLGNISIKYRNVNFIADRVFPFVPVKKESDKIRVYERQFRLPETLRSAKGVAREHNFNVSTSSYLLEQHSLKDYISDRDAENFEVSDLRTAVTEELTDMILLRMEKSVASLFTSTSWSQNQSLTAAQQWSLDTTTSNPIVRMDTGCSTVLEQSGMMPNYGIIPHKVMLAAKNHSSVLDRVKYVSAEVTESMLAGLFDLPEILVPKAVLDSSAEGATSSIAPLWGDNIFIGYKAQSPSIMRPSAGYTFRNAIPMVKRWRDEDRQSEAIEVNMHYQPKVMASLAGYLFKDALA